MSHPLRCDRDLHRKTYEAVCKKVKKWYGVTDAEIFFQVRRKAILDQCEPDEFGWARYESLREWHEAMSLAARHKEPLHAASSGPRCIESGRD